MPEEDVGLNGADVLLYVNVGTSEAPDYQPLAGQRGATREREAGTINTSHKLNKYERFIPGRLSSTMSFDGLWVPDNQAYLKMEEAYESQELIVARLIKDGEPWKEADGFLRTISESFPDQEAATISANFQISGAWRDVEVDDDDDNGE